MNELLSQVHSLVNSGMDMAVGMGAPDLILAGIFYALAGVAVLSAFGVVLCRNIVHSALLLAASFIGLGCLYIYLGADFMGAVQFLVYGGAVAILIVMVIMLTRRDSRDHFSPFRSLLHQVGAAAIAGGFC